MLREKRAAAAAAAAAAASMVDGTEVPNVMIVCGKKTRSVAPRLSLAVTSLLCWLHSLLTQLRWLLLHLAVSARQYTARLQYGSSSAAATAAEIGEKKWVEMPFYIWPMNDMH
ncbi:unnamed protein product [Onchocerca ochengi]|uniref:Secreted protein n=2 Tax=Onchocerca TaxID=6281 RepID=A0A182EAV4_ONCOC|nr:unnamed protein product [Onchocerca ochengi]